MLSPYLSFSTFCYKTKPNPYESILSGLIYDPIYRYDDHPINTILYNNTTGCIIKNNHVLGNLIDDLGGKSLNQDTKDYNIILSKEACRIAEKYDSRFTQCTPFYPTKIAMNRSRFGRLIGNILLSYAHSSADDIKYAPSPLTQHVTLLERS